MWTGGEAAAFVSLRGLRSGSGMPVVFGGALVVMAAGTSCGSGCSATTPVMSDAACATISGLAGAGAEVEAACRLGLRSGNGTTTGLTIFFAGFAAFVAFAVRDLEDCCLAANAPVAITGGRHNAQNTKSVT